ncbi:MAG: HAD family phosphatase [Chloroflexota bacterium]
MGKRAVIFDFGGVLFKTRDYGPRHAWDDKLGLPHGSVERAVHNDQSWVATQSGKLSLEDYWADVSERLNISVTEAVTTLSLDFYSGDELDPEVLGIVRQLRLEGITVALLSNDTADLLHPRIDRLGITDLFEPLIISSEIGVMKPAPAAYKAVLEQLGRPADETIFIDDRQENIGGAKAVGIHGIHYVDGMDLRGVLNPLLAFS